jgi:hypothetical protein
MVHEGMGGDTSFGLGIDGGRSGISYKVAQYPKVLVVTSFETTVERGRPSHSTGADDRMSSVVDPRPVETKEEPVL